jgi:predicted transcriptional regulator
MVSRLDKSAKRRKLSADEMAALAIEEFVEREEWQIAEIEAGLHEANQNDFASEEEITAVLAKYAVPASQK